jgi:hypothetical protein
MPAPVMNLFPSGTPKTASFLTKKRIVYALPQSEITVSASER